MLCVVHPATAAPLRPETVRVAILKGADVIRLDGNGVLVTDEQRMPLRITLPAQMRFVKGGVTVQGKTVRGVTLASPATMLVNGKKYRGLVELIPADKGGVVVNELPLEEYLIGLINCEISSQWPIDAIKAQAVIARSYALYQMEARRYALYHLESSVLDQVYDGAGIEDSRAARGVQETTGEVLTYNNKVIQAFYHSSCGGHTESAANVWGGSFPYLQGVACAYCTEATAARWDATLPLKKVEGLLKVAGIQASGLKEIRAGSSNPSGRLEQVVLVTARGNLPVPAVMFRKAVGYGVIKSTRFRIDSRADELIFSGVGNGHGVGLCQWGAKQRASDGFDYREILSYYYPGTKLVKLYSD